MAKKLSVSIISLGCFRNTFDSELVLGRILEKGYVLKNNSKCCDLLLVNTCGFIDTAKQESIDAITGAVELKKNKKVRKIAVFGCLVKRYYKELAKNFPDVDVWWGVESFTGITAKRATLRPAFLDFVKICEGCLNQCSYCAIPLIKGPLRSRTKDEILRECRLLDEKGVIELNLIGQDITSWGKDFNTGDDLTQLLKDILLVIRNIKWIRLIYTHPRNFTNSLADLIAAEQRICKYIDLPIQHINDRILKLMNRGITRKEIVNLIKSIRKKIPGCTIRTSIITGFPTETETEHKELIGFLKDIEFERLGVFTYSREDGTAAYNLSPQVHYQTKLRRFKEIMQQQQEITQQVNGKFVGRELDVLIEEKQDGVFIGRSQHDAYEVDGAVFINKKGLKAGEFYKAEITDVYGYDLVGK